MASSSCSSARLAPARARTSRSATRVGYNGARPLRHCHVSASASSSSIVVAGAAGQTGVRVVERLVERGFHVKAIVRDAEAELFDDEGAVVEYVAEAGVANHVHPAGDGVVEV